MDEEEKSGERLEAETSAGEKVPQGLSPIQSVSLVFCNFRIPEKG